MEQCECGRTYHPKQSWIHLPACRYLAGIDGRPELPVNHVKPEHRGYFLEPERETETVETETPVSDETKPWVKLGISRATYFRRRAENATGI